MRHASGNLLLAYGFDRARPPQNVIGASAYQLRLLADETHPRERVIALWGFGIWDGEWAQDGSEIGGIFIGRADFEPRWSADFAASASVVSGTDPFGHVRAAIARRVPGNAAFAGGRATLDRRI